MSNIQELRTRFENVYNSCSCPIWKSYGMYPSMLAKKFPDQEIYSCPRAGGIFRIPESLSEEEFPDETKVKVSRWIYEINCLDQIPVLTLEEIEKISRQQKMRMDKKIDALLQCVEKFQPNMLTGIQLIRPPGIHVIYIESYNEHVSKAATECLDSGEMEWLANAALELKLIRQITSPYHSLTVNGMRRLEGIWGNSRNSEQAFVAMWFDPSVDQAYRIGIEPAIEAAGYKAVRVDEIEHAGKIDDRIIAEIKRSRFLVCDFTCGVCSEANPPIGVARGGVYFEAGFAQGLNIPVIWTCREDCLDYMHFDIRQFNTIAWDTPENLRKKLQARIEAIIGNGSLQRW